MSSLITRAVLEGALPTSSVFALFSSLLLCAEGDESYFYVHDHLYDQVFHCGCSFLTRVFVLLSYFEETDLNFSSRADELLR